MTSDLRRAGATGRSRADAYDPAEIEPRWQQRWEELDLYRTNLGEPRNRYYRHYRHIAPLSFLPIYRFAGHNQTHHFRQNRQVRDLHTAPPLARR